MTERLLVTGCRTWANESIVRNAIASLDEKVVVIEGEAPGLDVMFRDIAIEYGHEIDPYPAYWNCKKYEDHTGEPCRLEDGRHEATHGRPAGPLRNDRMIDEGKPTLVWAFHDDLPGSKGTRDMVNKARTADLPIKHFSRQNPNGILI